MKHPLKHLIACVLILLSVATSAQAQKWVTYTTANSQILANDVSCIAFDGNGNKWVGFTAAGLAKFDGSNWTSFSDSLNQIYALSVASQGGNIWVATGNAGGLQKFDGTSFSNTEPENSFYPNWICPDNQGQVWVAAESGLSVYRTTGLWNTFKSTQTNTNLPTDDMWRVTTASDGNVWVSFPFENGMARLNGSNGNGLLVNSTNYPAFPDDLVTSIAVDGSGNAWAATKSSGLAKFDGTNVTVYSTKTDATWIGDNVTATAIDGCGHLWIGTDGVGAARLDGSTWTIFNKANSPLTNDSIRDIAVDGAGHVWLCTAEGLAEYKPLPQVVTLNYPANAAVITTDTVTASWWWDCPGIARYYFEIADNAAFTNSTIDTALTSFPGMPSKFLSKLVDKTTYYWRVKAENDAGYGPFAPVQSFSINIPPSGVSDNYGQLANGLSLDRSFPNPVSGTATIGYTVPEGGQIEIGVYNSAGMEVAEVFNGRSDAGQHTVSFDASKLANGSYFCRLSSTMGRIVQPITVEH